MNNRWVNEGGPQQQRPRRVYDSSENLKLSSSINLQSKATSVPFVASSPKIQDPPKRCAPQIGDRSSLDCSGRFQTMSDKIDHASSFQKFNTATLERDKGEKIRINTPSMNKILDGITVVKGLTIKDNLLAGKIIGKHWSTLNRYEEETLNPIGPGYYDATRFERSQYGSTQVVLGKFNKSERFHSEQEQTPQNVERINTNDNEISNEAEEDTKQYSSLSSNGYRFNDINRWNAIEYRQEKYIKTTGMALDHDFDHVFQKKIPFSFDKMSGRPLTSSAAAGSNDYAYEINPDYGMKATIATESRFSPIKYSAAFRSNAPVGMEVTIPTSGISSSTGTFKSSIEVKEPSKNSYFLLRDRNFPVKDYGPVDLTEMKTFAETHNRGVKFETAEVTPGGNKHLANWTKSKITKVYPRLGSKMFGKNNSKPMLNVDSDSLFA